MSVTSEVKSLGRSKWTWALVGALIGATLLYIPISKVVTWVKSKLPASLGGTATTAAANNTGA